MSSGKSRAKATTKGFDRIIGQLAEDFRKRGELNEQPLQLALEKAKTADLPLAFPGKVLADAKGDRLFIADSNHNRIVVTKLDGTLLDTIGTGEAGAKDGSFEKATFSRPQGMSLDGDALYVADTENHLIRRIDLRARSVSTVAGTGEQSRGRDEAGPARSIALNSPWDLQLSGRTLIIAMAGPHQIWQLDLDKEQVSTFAGSGREARTDGPRLEAAFAQPSGLASDGKNLYVADSESNIIRAIDLAPAGQVRTLAGGDLFKFGDREGRGDEARFQHPLGVVFTDGKLLIADTYNHKIKQLDPQTGVVKTFVGTGKSGQADGEKAAFYEPGGLSVANGKLFIADTNNHAVRTVDLRTKQATTLMIRGLRAPEESAQLAPAVESAAPNAEEIKLPTQRLRASSDGTLTVDVALPEGYHLNESAPQRFKASVTNGVDRLKLNKDEPTASRVSKDLRLPLRLPVRALAPGQAELRVQLTLYYCREDNTGTCQIKTLVWRAPVEVIAEETAPREIKAQGQIKL